MKQFDHPSSPFLARRFPIVLLLDDVRGPANIGGLFRLGDAFGVEKIIIRGGSVNLGSTRLRRTARSTIENIPVDMVQKDMDILSDLRQDGYTSIALEIAEESLPLATMTFEKYYKIALILGNERNGISPELLEQADLRTHVTMYGRNSSMNVSQAAAIALFQITKSLNPI